ncbi:11 [Orrella dioscoreae]|uniref:Uncharacterized protein n=1 Tax=Orrella dioscoreae TaxID=1851544 RepID=A0A1C3K1H1_9BURK|nr:11 [Orrella dioscoreae]SOE49125.1 11 [Orrella dioscoreae]
MDDDNQKSNTISSMFDILRDAELRANIWHFSKARAVLPALADKPLFGFSRQFQLPADFLRLIQIGGRRCNPRPEVDGWYSLEEGRILISQDGPLRIRYVKRVEDVTLFDALFVEAFACRLAMESAETLTNSGTKRQLAQGEYQQAMAQARRMNAIERPVVTTADDTWLEARR